MTLGAATGNPIAAAAVSESISMIPLLSNASSTFGGILALAYSGSMIGPTLFAIQKPWRRQLELECFLLLCLLIAVFIS